MHVKSLKVFCDVVGKRSFSRAADENGISQSGASQMVNQLEDHLGVKLIDRSKRPFVLTAEGQVYYDTCRQLVKRIYALEEEVRTMSRQVAGRVHVACIYSVGLGHMKNIVQEFMQAYPKANVRIEYQHPDRVYELVETDQVDFGILSYPKSKRELCIRTWREEPMALVCAPSHPLSTRQQVTLPELDGLAMISFDDNLQIRHHINRALTAARVHAKVAMEFDNIESIKRGIEIDLGVSLLPAFTVRNEVKAGTLVAVPLADESFRRPVGIIQRRGKELGQTARRFMQMLLDRAEDPRIDGLNRPNGEAIEK